MSRGCRGLACAGDGSSRFQNQNIFKRHFSELSAKKAANGFQGEHRGVWIYRTRQRHGGANVRSGSASPSGRDRQAALWRSTSRMCLLLVCTTSLNTTAFLRSNPCRTRHTKGDPERSPLEDLRQATSYFAPRRRLMPTIASPVPSRSSVEGSGTGVPISFVRKNCSLPSPVFNMPA